MNLGVTDNVRPLLEAVQAFIKEYVIPVDEEFLADVDKGNRWTLTDRQKEILNDLKSEARKQGL